MKTRSEAVLLIRDLVVINTQAVKEENTLRGLSKKTRDAQNRAIENLFSALTGNKTMLDSELQEAIA